MEYNEQVLEIYNFLKEAKVFYLATIDNNEARVRPFGAVNLFKDRIYLQTGMIKNVYKQIILNPKVELCAFNKGVTLRLRGELIIDKSVEAQEDLLNNNEELKSMYSVNDGNNVVMYFKDATASFTSFNKKAVIYKI